MFQVRGDATKQGNRFTGCRDNSQFVYGAYMQLKQRL